MQPDAKKKGWLLLSEDALLNLLERIIPSWFDRYNPRHLFRAFVALTAGSALVYFGLSFTENHGIVDGSKPTHNLLTALYFSIATETTVGYGDVLAKGIARAFACLQALLGLTLAGMTVEKITSAPGGSLRKPVKQCAGTWTEFIEIPFDPNDKTNTRLMICFINIAYLNATIRYDGNNFNQDGKELGYFRGELAPNASFREQQLAFRYSNKDSEAIHFGSGVTTLTFTECVAARQFNKFHGVAHDDTLHFDRPLIGLRATQRQADIINGTNFGQKQDFAVRQAQRYDSRNWKDLQAFVTDANIPYLDDPSDDGRSPLPESQYRNPTS